MKKKKNTWMFCWRRLVEESMNRLIELANLGFRFALEYQDDLEKLGF